MTIIITIIPKYLVAFAFILFLSGGWSGYKKRFLFIASRSLLQSHGEIDSYKRIFFNVIPVRIIVSWFNTALKLQQKSSITLKVFIIYQKHLFKSNLDGLFKGSFGGGSEGVKLLPPSKTR